MIPWRGSSRPRPFWREPCWSCPAVGFGEPGLLCVAAGDTREAPVIGAAWGLDDSSPEAGASSGFLRKCFKKPNI
ncbi:hypothetical protein SBV1_1530048 [Verrucomicrobia bacterium]|nr:hypothetical protein SBV1_1530048 [Verrucomicrobiota bacterium]